jgi:hypothetical protein
VRGVLVGVLQFLLITFDIVRKRKSPTSRAHDAEINHANDSNQKIFAIDARSQPVPKTSTTRDESGLITIDDNKEPQIAANEKAELDSTEPRSRLESEPQAVSLVPTVRSEGSQSLSELITAPAYTRLPEGIHDIDHNPRRAGFILIFFEHYAGSPAAAIRPPGQTNPILTQVEEEERALHEYRQRKHLKVEKL